MVCRKLSTLIAAIYSVSSVGAAEFRVAFSPKVATTFTGRVYVMTSKGAPHGETPSEPNWFQPAPFSAVDVKNLRAGEQIVVGANALGYPGPPSTLQPGDHMV